MEEHASAARPDPDQASDRRGPSLAAIMVRPRIVRSALMVSAVVGTLLNLVNNGHQLWTFHTVDLWQVACYSAARHESRRTQGD
jgi:hypothetical protein